MKVMNYLEIPKVLSFSTLLNTAIATEHPFTYTSGQTSLLMAQPVAHPLF